MSPIALKTPGKIHNENDGSEICRPGSPNLLGGIPEGIKRKAVPFYENESPPARATTPLNISPSKKGKRDSPRSAASTSSRKTVESPKPISQLAAEALALLTQRMQLRQNFQSISQPPPQAPQTHFRSSIVLQEGSKSNKENNGLKFTVTRNAVGAKNSLKPLRRSKKTNMADAKGMDIAEYQEALRVRDDLDREAKARAIADESSDYYDDFLSDDGEAENEDRDETEMYGPPDFYVRSYVVRNHHHSSDSDSSDFSDKPTNPKAPVGDYGATIDMFPELQKISSSLTQELVVSGRRYQLEIRPHKKNFTIWDNSREFHTWVGYLVISDAIRNLNRKAVPLLSRLRVRFCSYQPDNLSRLSKKDSLASPEFKVDFPECVDDPDSNGMIFSPWKSAAHGWAACFRILLPASLFASRKSRKFRAQAQLLLFESLQYHGLESPTIQVTVDHLRMEEETGYVTNKMS